MNQEFQENEQLLRAVWPAENRPDFWCNGHITSAVFKDPNGLSVDRVYDRPLEDAIAFMRSNLKGSIISITVQNCLTVNAYVCYCPTKQNPYHSEIHKSRTEVQLSDSQARKLSKQAIIVYE